MKLSEQDAELFLDLMWSLQFYANQRLRIIPNVKSIDDYAAASTEDKAEVREALYENMKLIDSFIQENPQSLSEEELTIVSRWRTFVRGEFHIERFLRKYAVFIKDNDVYGVLGLYQGLDEMIHRSRLPLYVETVLLPFKGKIVYDGVFQAYNFHFGGGFKRSLRESYMRAKQNNRIIESLDPTQQGPRKETLGKPSKDWMPDLDELAAKANALRGSAAHPAIYSPAFSMVKASIEFAQQAVSDPGDLDQLYRSLRKVSRALNKSSPVLDREEY